MRVHLRSVAAACLLAATTAVAAAYTPTFPTFPGDLAALVAVAAFNPSFNNTKFGNPWVGDPCINSWHGVRCDSSSKVISLDLRASALTGPIPPQLSNLTSLQYLFLNFNHLTGAIPPDLGALANLQELSLYYNNLTGVIPPELGNLSSLRYLWLGDNSLTGSIPQGLGALPNLMHLDLTSLALTGAVPRELGKNNTYINLGCMVLSSADAAFVCTEWACKPHGPCLDDMCNICYVPHPRATVIAVWMAWCGVGFLVLASTLVASRLYYPAAQARSPTHGKSAVTLVGIGKYLWGLLGLFFILFDVVTNFQVLAALVGSWSLYVVASLMVLQHVASGVLLYALSVRREAWPVASSLRNGFHVKWKWDWRRCIIGFQGDQILAADGKGGRRPVVLRVLLFVSHLLLWPLGLVYVVWLDILSLLALKVGFQCRVGSDWVNLEPYWASRELSDAFLQALPQAIFQSVLLLTHANPAYSKIFITRRQFVLSASSSLGSVVVVSAMVLWEARAEGENVLTKMWRQFFGLLPRILE